MNGSEYRISVDEYWVVITNQTLFSAPKCFVIIRCRLESHLNSFLPLRKSDDDDKEGPRITRMWKQRLLSALCGAQCTATHYLSRAASAKYCALRAPPAQWRKWKQLTSYKHIQISPPCESILSQLLHAHVTTWWVSYHCRYNWLS